MLLLWSRRRSNDRVIQNQSHQSAIDRISWCCFASRVIHMFVAGSISVIFISFCLDRKISSMCAKRILATHALASNEIYCRAVMYREIEGYYYLIRSIKLHYGTTTTNVRFHADLGVYQRFSPERGHYFCHIN